MAALTAEEAAVYDRQLRVWGVEAQQRMRSSHVLVLGCRGAAIEVRTCPSVSPSSSLRLHFVSGPLDLPMAGSFGRR